MIVDVSDEEYSVRDVCHVLLTHYIKTSSLSVAFLKLIFFFFY